METPILVPLSLLDPHPDNPRLRLRDDVIETIRAQLTARGFDAIHAVVLRPLNGRYQTIDGHHRIESAKRADLTEVPAWVREFTDEEAFMQLALANAQSGLTAIERGLHALRATTKYARSNNGTSVLEYAKNCGRKRTSIEREISAAEVYEDVTDVGHIEKYASQLVAIHAAPREMWRQLAEQMVANDWTVEETEHAVKATKTERQRKENTALRLEEWKKLSDKRKLAALQWRELSSASKFNEQQGDSIDWAKWSWNPVTGCLHNCPYCYARDIAERFYPEKFEPTLHAERLHAPSQTNVPAIAAGDMSYRNVFVCSMADLFGQWVPKEWIDAVLTVVRENPQWNFLFLTKFPIRMAEFEYPDNAWLGTSVDLQARVKNAERAMRKVKASVKWLSIEPLLEPLQFTDMSAFQWIVIGGASKSTQTPEWRPPVQWTWHLTLQALAAGCAVYHKTNLPDHRLVDFPGHTRTVGDVAAPDVFRYLKVIA